MMKNWFYLAIMALGLYLIVSPTGLALVPVWNDGFESFDNWTGTYYNSLNTIEISNEQKVEGSFSCKVTMPETSSGVAYAYKNLDATYTNIIYQTSLFLSETGLGASRRYNFMWIKGTTDPTYYFSTYASLRIESSSRYLVLYYRDSDAYKTKSSSTTVPLNTWNTFKISLEGAESSTAKLRVYMNGAEVTSLSTDYNCTNGWGGIKSVRVGGELNSAEAGIYVTSYLDAVQVSHNIEPTSGNLAVNAYYDGALVDAQFMVNGQTYQTTTSGTTISLPVGTYPVVCTYNSESTTKSVTISETQTTTVNFQFSSTQPPTSDEPTTEEPETPTDETSEEPPTDETPTEEEPTANNALLTQGIGVLCVGVGFVQLYSTRKKRKGGD